MADITADDCGHGSGAKRRHVAVNGRRIRTVDIHAHCVITAATEVVERQPAYKPKPMELVPEVRLREMDEQGVDVEALSINPFWYKADRDRAAEAVRINNDALAGFCAAHPERFVAFASVALQFPDLAIAQLVHAVKKLNLRGVAVGAHVGPKEFSDPEFHPFWAKCEELGILVFIHPTTMQEITRLKGNGALASVIGNPLDTTIALSHLIFEGTLDRFPGLKICAAHGGGYLPSYIGRTEYAYKAFADRMDPKITLKKKPSEYLRQLYFDSVVMTTEGLRHLAAVVGPDRIMMGSDHPAGWTADQVDHILNTPGLTDDDRAAMLGESAARLLRLDPLAHSDGRGVRS